MNVKEVAVEEEIGNGDEMKIIIKIVRWYYKYIINKLLFVKYFIKFYEL